MSENIGTYLSPIGPITIVIKDAAITGIWLPGNCPAGLLPRQESHEIFRRTCRWLDRYFEGKIPDPAELPLAPRGTQFQQIVWQLLLGIPYGTATTYGQIATATAARLKKPSMSAQAVGSAIGKNPISIVIPCHRVLGSGNTLTGYAGGLKAKEYLLKLEGIDFKPDKAK